MPEPWARLSLGAAPRSRGLWCQRVESREHLAAGLRLPPRLPFFPCFPVTVCGGADEVRHGACRLHVAGAGMRSGRLGAGETLAR